MHGFNFQVLNTSSFDMGHTGCVESPIDLLVFKPRYPQLGSHVFRSSNWNYRFYASNIALKMLRIMWIVWNVVELPPINDCTIDGDITMNNLMMMMMMHNNMMWNTTFSNKIDVVLKAFRINLMLCIILLYIKIFHHNRCNASVFLFPLFTINFMRMCCVFVSRRATIYANGSA